MPIYAFSNGDTRPTFRAHLDGALNEIRSLQNEYVLNVSAAELEQHYLSKVTIDPIVLDEEGFYIENQHSTQADVEDYGRRVKAQSTVLEIAIAYKGDRQLWQLKPSMFTLSGYPSIEVREDVVVLKHMFRDSNPNPEQSKREIERAVQALAKAVMSSASDVTQHNQEAIGAIQRAIGEKRRTAEIALNVVTSLGIPIKKRDQSPTYALPLQRRPVPAVRPKAPAGSVKSEPTLLEEDFDFILGVMKSMSMVIERNPSTFVSLQEPDIRNFLLLLLNGYYQGTAMGEVFNASGKTDILIRVEDRNVFIGECKFWGGPASFEKAIDQLLGYLSWRDTKAALLVFNGKKNSSGVQAKMDETMRARREFRKIHPASTADAKRYVFVKESDEGREIQICTMLFDVPRD